MRVLRGVAAGLRNLNGYNKSYREVIAVQVAAGLRNLNGYNRDICA